jgi:NAD(P)-dependent dehydrogenase (short-subunit alcohol dehydrogenase family)
MTDLPPPAFRDLRDRSVIVTGGGSGIGAAAALRFAEAGADVFVADRTADAASAVAAAIKAHGLSATAITVDVTDEAAVARMAATVHAAAGGIDVLYANAGIEGAGTAIETDRAAWAQVLDVNLTGVWLSIRAVLPAMVASGRGSIITQSSTAGLVGVRGLAAYSAAKGGVIALTRQIAVEYGAAGVRANAICPGTVMTPLVERTYEARGGEVTFGSTEDMVKSASRGYPLGRLGTVDEVAALALFLASDDAGWITGGVFTVDGGYTAR